MTAAVVLAVDGVVEPDGVAATLGAIARTVGPDVPTVVLERPSTGPAGRLNELLATTTADVVVRIEAGAEPGPGWLEQLLAPFAADDVAATGPSTGTGWNEQAAVAATDAAAGAAAALHLGPPRTLAPLHSLGDFCYAVRRAAVEALGPFDEAYGDGPCWEMDFNARAAFQGWRTLWVPTAYVHRQPFSARRRALEDEGFDASRRRYQEAHCRLHAEGRRVDHDPHCEGEACEHFGPPGRPTPVAVDARPLVSCIMPTGGRPDFALQAVEHFLRQHQPRRELLVLDDGDDDLAARLPDDPRIRYLRARPGLTIGAKRNLLCDQARGDVIVHWDDDDWYAPHRLTAQVTPILEDRADVTGIRGTRFLDLEQQRSWTCTAALHRALFVGDVHGGTLAYRRSLWRQRPFPDLSLAEDAWFLAASTSLGARLEPIANDGLFLYVRHGANAWAFPCGSYYDASAWREVDEPPLPAADRAFYRAHVPVPVPAPVDAEVRVTCIMPTADRRPFVARAIEHFLGQTYRASELLIVDDGVDAVADLVPDDPRIRYVRLEEPLVLGAKRNLACELATGDVIVHWDDDDWSGPDRVARQVAALVAHGAEVCGTSRLLHHDVGRGEAWRYVHPPTHPTWVAGCSLAYTKARWSRRRFRPLAIGEDNDFVLAARHTVDLADEGLVVAVIHAGNTSPKLTAGSYWQRCEVAEVEAVLGAPAATLDPTARVGSRG